MGTFKHPKTSIIFIRMNRKPGCPRHKSYITHCTQRNISGRTGNLSRLNLRWLLSMSTELVGRTLAFIHEFRPCWLNCTTGPRTKCRRKINTNKIRWTWNVSSTHKRFRHCQRSCCQTRKVGPHSTMVIAQKLIHTTKKTLAPRTHMNPTKCLCKCLDPLFTQQCLAILNSVSRRSPTPSDCAILSV